MHGYKVVFKRGKLYTITKKLHPLNHYFNNITIYFSILN